MKNEKLTHLNILIWRWWLDRSSQFSTVWGVGCIMCCKSRRTKNRLLESWHRKTIVCKQRWNRTESNYLQRCWQTIRDWRKRYLNFFCFPRQIFLKPAKILNIYYDICTWLYRNGITNNEWIAKYSGFDNWHCFRLPSNYWRMGQKWCNLIFNDIPPSILNKKQNLLTFRCQYQKHLFL